MKLNLGNSRSANETDKGYVTCLKTRVFGHATAIAAGIWPAVVSSSDAELVGNGFLLSLYGVWRVTDVLPSRIRGEERSGVFGYLSRSIGNICVLAFESRQLMDSTVSGAAKVAAAAVIGYAATGLYNIASDSGFIGETTNTMRNTASAVKGFRQRHQN